MIASGKKGILKSTSAFEEPRSGVFSPRRSKEGGRSFVDFVEGGKGFFPSLTTNG